MNRELLDKLLTRLYARPWLLLALMTAAVLAVGHRALLIEQDNSPDTFFSANKRAQQTYHEMVATFGGDEVVLLQLGGARVDRPRDLMALRELGRELSRLPRVKRLLSVIHAGPGNAAAELEEGELPSKELATALRREAEAIGLYRELGIYRPDVPALGVAALVVMNGPNDRPELAAALDRIAKRFRARGYRPLVASLATANAAIDRETRRSLSLFMPLVVLLALVIGLLLFRSARAVAALFLPVGGAVAVGVGGLQLAGETLNLVTGVMPPLVLAVGFAGAIHLVSHYAACCCEEPTVEQAIRRTMREKFIPTAFAFLTTALGFGSLALSEVHAVRVLGLGAAGSLLVALVLVTVGTPAFLLVLKPKLDCPSHRHRLLERVARLALRWRLAVLAVGALALAFTIGGGRRVTASVDGLDLLAKDTPERVAYQSLERAGIGLGNVDLWIHTKLKDRNALLAAAPKLAKLARELQGKEQISGTIGAHDLLEIVGYRMTQRAEVPASLAALDITLEKPQRAALHRALRAYWHPKKGLKLTLLTISSDEATVRRRERLIRAAVARHFPETKLDISGHFTMLIGTPGALTRTMVESLALSAGVITLLFFVFFRSPLLVLAGMLANLMPVGLVLGLMGFLGVPLDVATVMTGSVAFGIAVDDTFHYLYHHKKSGSILCAANIAGQGIVATSIVIAGSFCALALSGFNPVVRFGLLTALAVITALGIDALLLPALVGRREAPDEGCP
jgi:predicted RND superfamily exporter protein